MAVNFTLDTSSQTYRCIGLSSDTKPTTAILNRPNSTFYETDTKNIYVFDGTAWHLM